MPDQRTRWTMAIAGIVVAAVSGVGYVVARSSQPTPIVISGPAGDPPPPISGGSSTTTSASASPASSVSLTSGSAAAGASSNAATATPAAASTAQIAVDVSGAVHHPTMYYLPPGSRVQQAIHAAGGPTADADLDQINLAEKLVDGEKIYIPRRGHNRPEMDTYIPRHGHAETPDTIMPVPPAPVEIPQYVATQPGSTSGETQSPTAIEPGRHSSHGHSSSNKLKSPADGQIDLNSATAEDLQRLPGVGPAMSARIIAYRTQNGPFHSVDDLRQVSGIGDKKLARWSPFLVIH